MKRNSKQEYLDAIKHSRPREKMPRPVVFADKTKCDRSHEKEVARDCSKDYDDN